MRTAIQQETGPLKNGGIARHYSGAADGRDDHDGQGEPLTTRAAPAHTQ